MTWAVVPSGSYEERMASSKAFRVNYGQSHSNPIYVLPELPGGGHNVGGKVAVHGPH